MSHQVCPDCLGRIIGTRRIPLATAVANHEQSCPAKNGKTKT